MLAQEKAHSGATPHRGDSLPAAAMRGRMRATKLFPPSPLNSEFAVVSHHLCPTWVPTTWSLRALSPGGLFDPWGSLEKMFGDDSVGLVALIGDFSVIGHYPDLKLVQNDSFLRHLHFDM